MGRRTGKEGWSTTTVGPLSPALRTALPLALPLHTPQTMGRARRVTIQREAPTQGALCCCPSDVFSISYRSQGAALRCCQLLCIMVLTGSITDSVLCRKDEDYSEGGAGGEICASGWQTIAAQAAVLSPDQSCLIWTLVTYQTCWLTAGAVAEDSGDDDYDEGDDDDPDFGAKRKSQSARKLSQSKQQPNRGSKTSKVRAKAP